MIDLYAARTSNGYKISIMLEETGIPYEVHRISLSEGEQFHPDFKKINPNSKIPAIVERGTGQRIFESGAILIYLASVSGKFLATEPRHRVETLSWLFFQVAHIGPMLGQLWHFLDDAPDNEYGLTRYAKETLRLYEVAETRLAETRYLAGDDYSIADIASWPWLRNHNELMVDVTPMPNLRRWLDEIAARPAVQRGLKALA